VLLLMLAVLPAQARAQGTEMTQLVPGSEGEPSCAIQY
jgi:hypothetical protein